MGRGFRKPSQALAKDQKHITYVDSESIEEIARQASRTDNYPWTAAFMVRAQEADHTIAALKRLLQDKRAEGLPGDSDLLKGLPVDQFFISKDNLVYRTKRDPYRGNKRQLYIPESCRNMALEYCHHYLGIHPGITKTAYLIGSMFYWPTAYNDAARTVKDCATCQKTKGHRADMVPHGTTFLPILPYDCLSIDLLTPGKRTKKR